MSQAVLALHCPTKEDYLTALGYIARKESSCIWKVRDKTIKILDLEYAEVVWSSIDLHLEEGKGCLILEKIDGKVLLSWDSLEYCRENNWMIIPAVNFRTDQSTIPSRMCQEDAEKGESNE